MGVRHIIVGFDEINAALHGNFESVANEGVSAVTADGVSTSQAQMTALMAEALRELEEEDQGDGVMTCSDNQLASIWQSAIAAGAAEEGKLVERPDGMFEAKFDARDMVPWTVSFVRSLFERARGRFEFRQAADEPESLPDEARVAILGDWGSGLYGAPIASRSIESDGRFDVLLHLGDVYYAGTELEVKERFLDLWPKIDGAVSRSCNGNHEMYMGGRPYADLILPEFGQQASYFAMQNDHWLFVGLDTAYEGHDLYGDQVQWLDGLVERAGDRKVVLLTHHQPFSSLGKGGPRLVGKLGHLLDAGRIHAWYWGHEHQCILYDRSLWNMYGRCVGHGGFPDFRWRRLGRSDAPARPTWKKLPPKALVPGGVILDGPNQYIAGCESKYLPHGYLTLELDGAYAIEAVYDADGSLLHEDELS